jgi:hypothetical protein
LNTARSVPLAAAALAALAGCTHLPVQDLGHGRYSLTATAASGGFYGSREAAVEEANEFCRRHGEAAVTDGFYDKSELGPEGEHTSSILFRCAQAQPLRF